MTLARLNSTRTRGSLQPQSLCWLLLLAILAAAPVQGSAENTSADEYEIRAAMLMNLTKFIDWPAWKLDASHPQFLVCILGPDPIGPAADRYLLNTTAGGKPVQVKHLTSVDGAGACHILYVDVSERKLLDRITPELARNGVLIASERSNAISPNQVVGLPAVDEHVHIDINLTAAERSGLTISSKLLRLATVSH